MTKIWYCAICGYEVTSRGRCHLCKQRLVASSLPELSPGQEDDEVGYRLEDWVDRQRGRLIEHLNALDIEHRFEDDELVVPAEDETRVDDLIAELAATPDDDWRGVGVEVAWDEVGRAGAGTPSGVGGEPDEWVASGLRLLADAARRLRHDPTDMHADADVAEASAAVFAVDMYYDADDETWAAIGRVTRRLLSALGAEEALEGEIRSEAAILDKLLTPLVAGEEAEAAGGREPDAGADAGDAGAEAGEAGEDGEASAEAAEASAEAAETVYELPEWLPEQRAQLGVLLDEAGIGYEWDGPDLVVPAARESDVEARFEQVSGISEEDDDDEESRYRSLEELFAAAGRLAGDPLDEERAADAVARIEEAVGPLPIGMDEVYWFRIMTQARTLSESIGAGRDGQVIAEEATVLRDLLRTVV
jgi:hypothetical protein